MRGTTWVVAATVLAIAAGLVLTLSCEDSAKQKYPVYCRFALESWMDECGFTIAMDGINEMTYDEAYDSCKHGYGKVWELFRRCYDKAFIEGGRDCDAFAECVPEHGFLDDDDDNDDNDDNDTADDDTADDDTTDDDDDTSDDDDDSADDDSTDDDTV